MNFHYCTTNFLTAADEIFQQTKEWIDLFCSLRSKRKGYSRPCVTPYMDILAYHVPYFVKKTWLLEKFTGQGVKNNDDAKRLYFKKSNKWDALKDVLNTESRQWELRHCERVKAKYTKRSSKQNIL